MNSTKKRDHIRKTARRVSIGDVGEVMMFLVDVPS